MVVAAVTGCREGVAWVPTLTLLLTDVVGARWPAATVATAAD